MNTTVSSERKHIGFFGVRNSGKSSLANAFTGQSLSIVSDVLGTTTDPVKKTMELLPLGPVVIIDTPGIDDEGNLGSLRVQKALSVLDTIDIAILVVDATKGIGQFDLKLIDEFQNRKTEYIIVFNKCDLIKQSDLDGMLKKYANNADNSKLSKNIVTVSAKTLYNISLLKNLAAGLINDNVSSKRIVADLVNPGDIVVLVVPIDCAAPKGRLILPQQLTIRDILDAGAISVVTTDTQLKATLNSLNKEPALVITDSQVFGFVANIVPEHVKLTSFSILMMRYKGSLDIALQGASVLGNLKDGDTILISEGCTHHRQCEDIGTVKLPAWITNYTGKNLNFEFSSGHSFPTEKSQLSRFSLVIHCGGCMLTENEMKARIQYCKGSVPFTNYGIAIAKINSILDRSIRPLHS